MSNILTASARHAKAALHAANIDAKLSTLQEILAACLGYHSYSALKIEENDQRLKYHLKDAEYLILNKGLGTSRAFFLTGHATEVFDSCADALQHCMATPVFRGIETFYATAATQAVAAAALGFANKSTWGKYSEELEVCKTFAPDNEVWNVRESWHVMGQACLRRNGRLAKKERIIKVNLTFEKAGRAGIIFNKTLPENCSDSLPDVVVEQSVSEIAINNRDGSTSSPWIVTATERRSGIIVWSAIVSEKMSRIECDLITNKTMQACTFERNIVMTLNTIHAFLKSFKRWETGKGCATSNDRKWRDGSRHGHITLIA